jgi:3-phenylpropionate/cinnamic acid dioxygenase small subunit
VSVAALNLDLLLEVQQFVYREARFQDEHDYDAWEALWTDQATYWVPANGDAIDPTREMSIIFDNRSRIATRVKQLKTGKRHAQAPPSRVRRVVSNVELLAEDGEELVVGANFVVYESRERGLTLWAGRSTYRLQRVDGDLRMAYKKVELVDNDRAIFTLAFLI